MRKKNEEYWPDSKWKFKSISNNLKMSEHVYIKYAKSKSN